MNPGTTVTATLVRDTSTPPPPIIALAPAPISPLGGERPVPVYRRKIRWKKLNMTGQVCYSVSARCWVFFSSVHRRSFSIRLTSGFPPCFSTKMDAGDVKRAHWLNGTPERLHNPPPAARGEPRDRRSRMASPADNGSGSPKRLSSRSANNIGLLLKANQDNQFIVAALCEGSAAEQCGRIQVGDKLHTINGTRAAGLTPADVSSLLKVDNGLLHVGFCAASSGHASAPHATGDYTISWTFSDGEKIRV